ncbi:MAG: GEVED domain-containing protein, partial [Bacteroidota bacterium]
LFTLTVLNDRFFGAYVHAWIDYDADGVFDPVTEKAFTTSAISQSSSPQQIQVSASIPCDAAFGESYMRFRLDDNENGVLPTGARGIGEVEDYRYDIIGDFGDLPQDLVGSSDYPTEQASSGASHVILDSCFLGSTVDGEVDGQADLSADGDGADEDGIEFTTAPFVKNTSETISVLGFDDTGCANALLYCWADFNGDGTLNNAEEFIINGGDPADVAFTFTTPATLSTSQVYVRCRYSTDPAAASPTGRASNGEVEDYLVTGALPVELSAFELSRADMQVELSWQTLTETDNAGFSIEHRMASCSSDCAWSELSFVQGAGTTETPQAYAYRTAPLEPGVHQFRLKQVDFDGQHSYSAVLEQRLDVPSAAYLEPAYPNPFNPSTQIRFTMEDRGEVYVGLYDLTGRHVKTLFEGDVEAGQSQTLRVDASGLPSGTYVIRLEGAKAQSTQRITLIK